jgi:hypothetical protein
MFYGGEKLKNYKEYQNLIGNIIIAVSIIISGLLISNALKLGLDYIATNIFLN